MRAVWRVVTRLGAWVSQLAFHVVGEAALPRTQAGSGSMPFFSAIGDALVSDESVALLGFGSFRMKARAVRQWRNPRTGGE